MVNSNSSTGRFAYHDLIQLTKLFMVACCHKFHKYKRVDFKLCGSLQKVHAAPWLLLEHPVQVHWYYLVECHFRVYDKNLFYQENPKGIDILHYRALF